ncbi:plasma membrane ATPase 4 [Olea europaea subsp. europaea]|uniref:Plasma membrane ATPase 4 n=1 Tax=Olea europaea subsp. europaea TaxID=158383 RepID=A0A8S0ST40_OLEEU|nr:plasma membrane ATPase 4 [Olea europaea subsp. europaea]
MIGFYDNWSRLVEAVLQREQLREIALGLSRSPSSSSLASDYSSSLEGASIKSSTNFPFHPAILGADNLREEKQSGAKMVPANRRNKWEGLRIFNAFIIKKDYGKEEKEVQVPRSRRTLHPLKTPETTNLIDDKRSHSELSQLTEQAKRRDEMARQEFVPLVTVL